MDKILHDPKDPKLWELWYIPYYGSCRILSISRRDKGLECGRSEGALQPWSGGDRLGLGLGFTIRLRLKGSIGATIWDL